MTVSWFDGASVTLEVGFASAPTVAIGSTTWTDISAYIWEIQTSIGRSDELGSFKTGSATITLDNSDRRFDPNYASSPYVGNLVPRKRIRLRWTYSGTTYAMWCGFIDDWPQSYDVSNRVATVTLQCTDGFGYLADTTLAESYWETYFRTNTSIGVPAAWWRFGETSGQVAVDSSGNGYNGTYSSAATTHSTTGLITFSGDKAIAFDGVFDFVGLPSPVTAFPYTIGFSFSTTTANGRLFIYTGPTYPYHEIGLTGGTIFASQGGAGALRTTTTTATYNDGETHQVVVAFLASVLTPTIYIDGAVPTTTTFSSGTTAFPDGGSMYFATNTAAVTAATIDEAFVYASDVTLFAPSLYQNATGTRFTQVSATTAVTDILDLTAWPSSDRTIDALSTTGLQWLDAVGWPGPKNVLDVLNQLALGDNGQFYIGPDGFAVYESGTYRYVTTRCITSQATFGDSGVELPYTDIETDGGSKFLRNRVRVATSNFSTVDTSDSTSIAAYLESTLDLTIGPMSPTIDTTGFRFDLANWKLKQLKDPTNRITTLVVNPRALPSRLFPQVLGRLISDRVTVNRRPQNVGTALSFTVLIEGISHHITRDGMWETKFYLSSSDTQPMWVWDDDVLGILDTDLFGY